MKQFVNAESVALLHSGNEFFDTIQKLIDEAKEVIHFQTYIFTDDATGRLIADRLIAASQRGVKVFLLLDGYGSKELPIKFIDELKTAGIHFRFFSQFFSSENISPARRVHHKIIVVDKYTAVLGGINIGDKYHGSKEIIPWLDFAVLIKGKCNEYLDGICSRIYTKRKQANTIAESNGDIPVRYRVNDWAKRKNEIYYTYKYGVSASKRSITIVASYFLPGFFFLRRLKNAAKRGVVVKIVVGGVSDIAMFHHAEKYLYAYLIRNGIEVYEWTDSVMHGKAAVFDEKLTTIGSYNLNNLSKYKCIEMNVDIKDAAFGKVVYNDFESIIQNKCIRIAKEDSNLFKRIRSTFAYYLYKLVMYLIAPRE